MKNKILSSVLIFMFAWVAVGALDCGCAFASSLETIAPEATKTSESMDCHGPAETQTKQEKDACCSGCKLESKAPFPPSVILTGPSENKLSAMGPDVFQSAMTGEVFTEKSSVVFPTLQDVCAHSVSVYGTPIYLALQSFLI